MDEISDLVRYFTNRLSSMRGSLTAPGAIYRSTGVGLNASEFEQLRGNAWYRAVKLDADAHTNSHWAPQPASIHEPNYHPIPLGDFLSAMQEQQKEDLEFLYELGQREAAEYFMRKN